jgi:YesN/AraC family two-component response regulator
MTKLLIVDDDRFIREGLSDLIDWAELGVDIVGSAEGGHEALRIMSEQRPDILITDIQMPQGDGLELIAQIRSHNWDTQIIVLSGYNDYEYVRKAMKYQVEDYLLKPVDENELSSIIKTLCERKHAQWVIDQLKRESFQLLCNNVLLRWMENRIDSDQLREKLDFLNMDMRHYDYFQIAIITWQDWNEGKLSQSEQNFRSFAIINSVDEALRKESKGIAFPNQDREIVCLLTGTSSDYPDFSRFSTENLQWMQNIAASYAPLLKTPWFCSIGNVTNKMQAVHLSYQDAKGLQDYIHLTAGPICVDTGYIQNRQNTPSLDIMEHEPLVAALISGDHRLCLEAIATDFQWAAAQPDPLSAAKFIAAEWLVLIKLAIKQKKLQVNDFFDQRQIVPKLYASHDIGEIRSGLLLLLNEIENALDNSSAKKKNPILEQVEHYVQKHYMDELSLQILASLFNVNNVYLGRLFKEETNEYFSDYLTRIRLIKAKELLTTTFLKPTDIANQIGFLDANYFFRKFKHNLGLSPMEYRSLYTE